MVTLRIVISIAAFVLAFRVAKSKERKPWLWSLLSLAFPTFPGYLLQTVPKEKIIGSILTRSILSGVVGFGALALISSPDFDLTIDGFEEMVHSHVSTALNALGMEHYRDGAIFEFPTINIELAYGKAYLHTPFLLAIIAASISLFFRTRNPVWNIAFTVFFAIVGYCFAIAIVVSTFAAMQNPGEINEDYLKKFREFYWILGSDLIYLFFYLVTWYRAKTMTQNKSVLANSEAEPSAP